jgi:hypothetical protein
MTSNRNLDNQIGADAPAQAIPVLLQTAGPSGTIIAEANRSEMEES